MNFSKINLRNTKQYFFIQRVIKSEQISVLEAIKYSLTFWKLFPLLGGIFFVLGLFLNLGLSDKVYTSESILISDESSPQLLVSDELANFISQPIKMSSSNLGIQTFPVLVEYYPFLLSLLQEKILFERLGGYVTLREYLAEINKPSNLDILISRIRNIPDNFFGLFRAKNNDNTQFEESLIFNDTLNSISAPDRGYMSYLSEQIVIEGRGGTLSIITKSPEAKISTRLNNLILDKLVNEVSRLKTARQTRNLHLIEKQLEVAKSNFESSQNKLANFRDENKGNNSAYVLSELDRLNSEYSLKFDIYSNLASKYELTKVELIENTPFFEVVEPAYVPYEIKDVFDLAPLIKNFIYGVLFAILLIPAYTGILVLLVLSERVRELDL